MVAALNHRDQTGYIRSLDLSSDLNHVADLVESCFPIHSDPDGQTYIREMRKAARDYRLLGWISQVDNVNTRKPAGFVWVKNGQIIGNMSLIPFTHLGKKIHLIANVAVHPNHRRQGIARALTIHALKHLGRMGDSEVWLQVRHNNPSAIHLYQSVGFEEGAVRTTWRVRPCKFQSKKASSFQTSKLTHREKSHWDNQKHWLAITYPQEIRWNLPLNFKRLQPGVFQMMSNILDGVLLRNWRIEEQGRLKGLITWQN